MWPVQRATILFVLATLIALAIRGGTGDAHNLPLRSIATSANLKAGHFENPESDEAHIYSHSDGPCSKHLPTTVTTETPPNHVSISRSVQADLDEEGLPEGCLHLRDVCADQQQLVLMSSLHRPDNLGYRPLPSFNPVAKYNFPFANFGSNPDPLVSKESLLPPLVFRTASSQEPTPDLQYPVFDSNTVPLIFYPTWQENFGHTLGNNVGWLFTHLWLSNNSWVDRIKLVVVTPNGLAIPKHWHPLVAAIVSRPLESFAEFSARWLPISPPRANLPTALRPDSPCRSRCYRDALVCGANDHEPGTNVWQASQHIFKHYRPQLAQPNVTYRPPLPTARVGLTPGNDLLGDNGLCSKLRNCSGSSSELGRSEHYTANSSQAAHHGAAPVKRAQGAASSNHGSSGNNETVQVLRILFVDRPGPAFRKIQNMEELLERCQGWHYDVPATGQAFRAACAAWVSSSSPLANMAAVHTADVLVGIHGAAMSNCFFMRPGSAVLELFSPAWPWHGHCHWLDSDPQAQLQWWGLIVKDPAAYAPGALELDLLANPGLGLYQGPLGEYKKQRDRNMMVPWAGIERMLQEMVVVRGNASMYEEVKRTGCRSFAYAPGQDFLPAANPTWDLL